MRNTLDGIWRAGRPLFISSSHPP